MDVSSVIGREPAMYVGGSWVGTDDGRPVINPADESTVAAVPEAAPEQAERALQSAGEAQKGRARRSGVERGAAPRTIARGIRDRQEPPARLVVAGQGKTIAYNSKTGPEQLQGVFQGYRLPGMGDDDGQYGYGDAAVDEGPANL